MSDGDDDDEILSGRARRSKLAKKGRAKMRTLADSSDEEPEFGYAVAAAAPPPPPEEIEEEDVDFSFSVENLRRAAVSGRLYNIRVALLLVVCSLLEIKPPNDFFWLVSIFVCSGNWKDV